MIDYGRFANPMGGPPAKINVIDRHGGFTIESKPPHWAKNKGKGRFDLEGRRWQTSGPLSRVIGDSLWRPGTVLKGSTTGTLIDFDRKSFYQSNDDVTIAVYRVPGYGYPVLAWFDNKTGERIA